MSTNHFQLDNGGSGDSELGKPRALMGWARDELNGWALVGSISDLDMPLGDRIDSSSAPVFSLPISTFRMENEVALNHFLPTCSPAPNQSPTEIWSTCFVLPFGPRCQPCSVGLKSKHSPLLSFLCKMLIMIPASQDNSENKAIQCLESSKHCV